MALTLTLALSLFSSLKVLTFQNVLFSHQLWPSLKGVSRNTEPECVCAWVCWQGGLLGLRMCVLGRRKAEGVDIAWGGFVTSAHWTRLPYVYVEIGHRVTVSRNWTSSFQIYSKAFYLYFNVIFFPLSFFSFSFHFFFKDGAWNNLLTGNPSTTYLSFCNTVVCI